MYGLRTNQKRGRWTKKLRILWATKVPQSLLGGRLGEAHNFFDATVAVRRHDQYGTRQRIFRIDA